MRPLFATSIWCSIFFAATSAFPALQQPLINYSGPDGTITPQLFAELEELARIVDISYCVGLTGIIKPFQCLSRCSDFPKFELVTTWNTGPLLSDSCGYIALDHSPTKPRIIVAFRGTYSLASTIADLSTIPQEYVPYIDEDNTTSTRNSPPSSTTACSNCTVHSGFLRSWHNTRSAILPFLTLAIEANPTYNLTLVGHSLGGAVALLASLECMARGWTPTVTTFGEPRVGNEAFAAHVDMRFADALAEVRTTSAGKERSGDRDGLYRRVTHVDDPVVLLPLTEWGYRPHGSELYISKSGLPPDVQDIQRCQGDEDATCSAGSDPSLHSLAAAASVLEGGEYAGDIDIEASSFIPARYKIWQLFFAHRDYFWRLGVCLPGGDPWSWKGQYPRGNGEGEL